MQKNRQDVIEICLYVHLGPSTVDRTISLPKYVGSNHFACAQIDLQVDLDDLPIQGLSFFLENTEGDIVYNKGLTLVNPVHPEKQTDVVVPVVDKDRKIKTTHMKKTDYKKYIEKNQITINKDTILNVYPLINWEHYNLEAGEYSLYLMYRDTTMASDSFFKRPLIISNKVCLIVEDCPVKWWMFWKRKNIDYHKFEKCILK